jgi:hypothetical protein
MHYAIATGNSHQLGNATFSASQVVGKTLFAKNDVPAKRSPLDSAPTDFTIKKGQPVGVVFSWINPAQGRSNLWWMFYDTLNRPYYVEHLSNRFDVGALSDQGAKTTEQILKELDEAQKRESQGDLVYYGTKVLKAGAFGLGAYLILKLVASSYTNIQIAKLNKV